MSRGVLRQTLRSARRALPAAAMRLLSGLLPAAVVFPGASAVDLHAGSPGAASAPRQAPAELVEQGIAALERGDEAAASACFERALAASPEDPTAHIYLGVLADRAGRLAEAEGHFAAAAAADPFSPAARNNHGAILLRLGRVAEAAAEFEASLRLDPRQASALVNLAQIRFASGAPEGLSAARELFERARAIAPDAEIARSLVIVALRLGDRAAAAEGYRDYAGRVAGAPEAVRAAPARAELGATLLAAGLATEAREELAAVVAAEPSHVDSIVLLARAQLAGGDPGAAERTLEAARARGVDAGPVHSALADLHESAGRFEKAIPAMRAAIGRDPGNESYRFRYGMLLIRARAPGAALVRLQEAVAERPGSARLWFALGLAQFSDHRNDEAARSFDRAVEIDPQFAPALAYRGLTCVATGRYQEALDFYERALAVDGDLGVAHYLAGDVLLKLSPADQAGAERHLARAVALDGAFAPARLALAKLYAQTERFAEAAKELEQVVGREPELAEAHYQLGRAYMRLKRAAEARAEMAVFQRLSDAARERKVGERQELVRRLADIRF